MRVQKLSLLAVVAAVAGLSLTACQGGDTSSSGAGDSSSPSSQGSTSQGPTSRGSGSQASDGSGASGGKGAPTASRTGGAMTSACTTSELAFSTSGGMAEGELIVNMKNTGSANCTLHGFPGVDLKSKDGTISASRSKLAVPTVTLQPGAETRFTLHYPPNTSGGTGETFTQLVVTPPNETHSTTLNAGINVPVTDGAPGITVDPVGTGK